MLRVILAWGLGDSSDISKEPSQHLTGVDPLPVPCDSEDGPTDEGFGLLNLSV